MVRVEHGDCREVIKTLAGNSIDACVTDPPYSLVSIQKRFGKLGQAPAKFGRDGLYQRASSGFMGAAWDVGDTAFDPEWWSEVLRVLKPGGHIVAMGGTRTYHRLACAIEDAGFEIRDTLTWLYGTGWPKSRNIGKAIDKMAGAERIVTRERYTCKRIKPGATVLREGAWGKQEVPYTATDTEPATGDAAEWEGWGTALKPAAELIVLARKPLSEKSVALNVLRWGTGALNIDACRVGTDRPPTTATDFAAWRTMERREDSQEAQADTDTEKGRWPANLCLSYTEDEYELRHDITHAQLRELYGWLHENA